MKRIAFKTLVLLLVIFSCVTSVFAQSLPSLEQTTLPKIEIPTIRKQQLPNGMKLFFLEDHELPIVRGYLFIKAGSLYDPATQSGLAQLTLNLLRSGGTRNYSPEAFDEKLASLGAEIETSLDREFVIVAFSCLKEDLEPVLSLFFDMLLNPGFDEKKLQLEKTQLLSNLKRDDDNPANIVKREFPKLIYGTQSAWSQTPSPASVEKIIREDVMAFYRSYYHPDQSIFAISGASSLEKISNLVRKKSEAWSKAEKPLPKIPELTKSWTPQRILFAKNVDQATIVLGHYGDKRFNPDKYALLLLNEILGGDIMTSRLGKRIRSSLGLSYGIYSHFGLETDHGIFSVFVQTKSNSAQQVLQEVQAIVEGVIRGDTLSDSELNLQRQSLLNSLYSQYEPRYNFVKDEARFELLGYPPNYLELFRREIQKVTLEDIRRVAKTYIKPEALSLMIVGDPKKIGPIPNLKVKTLE